MSEDAIKAEANGDETVVIEWRDLKFDLPLDRSEWSFEAGLALEDGKYLTAIRELLQPEQFEAFLATKPKAKDAGEIIERIVSALGAKSAGESPASSA